MKEERKGYFMYFSTAQGKPIYEYKPIRMEQKEADVWYEEMMTKYESVPNVTWIRNVYWKLGELSCVFVPRNKKWFADNLPRLAEVWSIIEKERSTGFSHRAPNKREKKETAVSQESKCLINLNKLKSKTDQVFESVIKIRTESIDETKQALEENEC